MLLAFQLGATTDCTTRLVATLLVAFQHLPLVASPRSPGIFSNPALVGNPSLATSPTHAFGDHRSHKNACCFFDLRCLFSGDPVANDHPITQDLGLEQCPDAGRLLRLP